MNRRITSAQTLLSEPRSNAIPTHATSRPFAQALKGTRRLLHVPSLHFLDRQDLPLSLLPPHPGPGKAVACVIGNHCLFPTKGTRYQGSDSVSLLDPEPQAHQPPSSPCQRFSILTSPIHPSLTVLDRESQLSSLSMRLIRHCQRPTPLS